MSRGGLTFHLPTLRFSSAECPTTVYVTSLYSIIERTGQCKISGTGGITVFQYFSGFLSWFGSLAPKEMKKEYDCESAEKEEKEKCAMSVKIILLESKFIIV